MTQTIGLLAEDREAALLGRLPPAARDTFRALQQSRDDAHGLLLLASAAAREARDDLRTAERDLEQMMRARKRDEVAEERQKARIAAERVELARRQRIAAEREVAWRPVQALVAHLVERLRDVPGHLVEAGAPDVKLRKGETPAQAVETRRARLAEIAHERAAVLAAPVPLDVAKERARAAVEALVAAGRPPVEALLQPDPSRFSWPLLEIDPQIVQGRAGDTRFTTAAEPPPVPHALGIAAWVDPEPLLRKVLAEIEAVADASRALSDEDRRARLSALQDEERQVEREEEALVRLAEAQNVMIARRPNASALAVLGVQIVAEPVEADMAEAA